MLSPFLFFEKHNIYNKHISYIMEQNIEQHITRGIGAQQSQSLRDYPFPTEIISLPSKGLIYPEGNPLAKGQITIKLMTAKEEDIITSPNLIKKGIQLDKMLESIVVEPGVNINDLSIGDKNAILVSTRLLAFGADYLINVIDKVTREESEVIIDLSQIKIKEIDESLLNRKNEYDYVLPVSKTPIKFKILNHGDEQAINKDIEASEKFSKQSNEITTRYRKMIIEVDGNRDLGFISSFVSNRLLAGDSKGLRKYVKSITPDLDLTYEHTHSDGETEALRIPFGINFFYPAD
jgi:hypothetical protein